MYTRTGLRVARGGLAAGASTIRARSLWRRCTAGAHSRLRAERVGVRGGVQRTRRARERAVRPGAPGAPRAVPVHRRAPVA